MKPLGMARTTEMNQTKRIILTLLDLVKCILALIGCTMTAYLQIQQHVTIIYMVYHDYKLATDMVYHYIMPTDRA